MVISYHQLRSGIVPGRGTEPSHQAAPLWVSYRERMSSSQLLTKENIPQMANGVNGISRGKGWKNWKSAVQRLTIIGKISPLDKSYIIRLVMSTNVTKSTRYCVEAGKRRGYLGNRFT